MATIPGSQFVATAPGQPVNVVETTTGLGLPATVPGAFNLEVFVGLLGLAPTTPAPGYQGLAVLSPSGLELDLISGAFAVTDDGTGNDTLSAYGSGETVVGAAGSTLNLFGTGETATGGGGPDTIGVYGNNDVVNGGSGDDTINVGGTGDIINGGSGNAVINVSGAGDSVNGGSGSDTINAFANMDTINGGTTDTINAFGTGDFITTHGSDTVNVFGNSDTVTAGVNAGANQGLINVGGTDFTFVDGPNQYTDTVVGFDQAAGDRIHLTGSDTVAYALAHTTSENSGQDTLITLNDGSTILLKGVTHIDGTFFS